MKKVIIISLLTAFLGIFCDGCSTIVTPQPNEPTTVIEVEPPMMDAPDIDIPINDAVLVN